MGHVVFAAPSIRRFHLHDLLARHLQQRDHRVTVLTDDPSTEQFYATQGLAVIRPRERDEAVAFRAPFAEFATRDARLAGRSDGRTLARARQRLERIASATLRFWTTERPDLVLTHDGRSGLHRLLDYLAREFGSTTLHTGDGLLARTMQWDEDGLDGDSTAARRTIDDYLDHPSDELFCAAALAAQLGTAAPPPLARRTVHRPDLSERLGVAARALVRGDVDGARDALTAWRRACTVEPGSALVPPSSGSSWGEDFDLPPQPFVAVLLQDDDDARVQLDAINQPSAERFAERAVLATHAFDPSLHVVLVAPPRIHGRIARLTVAPHVAIASPDATPLVTALALAVATINAPGGLAALLAGTSVVHTGRAAWGLEGLTVEVPSDELTAGLARAITMRDPVVVRQRVMTRLLAFDHLWCDASAPDTNGLRGLVQAIERRIDREPKSRAAVDYRAGPVWPLATTEPRTPKR